MNTTLTTGSKRSVSFRWDSDLVDRLKQMAKLHNRSLSSYAASVLYNAIEKEDDEKPNEITLAAMKEAKNYIDNVNKGKDAGKDYVDLTSVETMLKSAGI